MTQNPEMPVLSRFGVAEENIIVEKLSGKDFRRPQYQRLVRRLRPGDVLVVKSIDRLGRNYAEILEQWGTVTKERAAAIVVLALPGSASCSAAASSFTRRRKVWWDTPSSRAANYAEILEQWGTVTKERAAAIVVLDMPLLDTRQGRDLTGTLRKYCLT